MRKRCPILLFSTVMTLSLAACSSSVSVEQGTRASDSTEALKLIGLTEEDVPEEQLWAFADQTVSSQEQIDAVGNVKQCLDETGMFTKVQVLVNSTDGARIEAEYEPDGSEDPMDYESHIDSCHATHASPLTEVWAVLSRPSLEEEEEQTQVIASCIQNLGHELEAEESSITRIQVIDRLNEIMAGLPEDDRENLRDLCVLPYKDFFGAY